MSQQRRSRIARALLRLYSPTFRGAFGADALGVLDADLAEAGSGARGLARRFVVLAEFAVSGIGDRLGRVSAGLSMPRLSSWAGWGQDVRLALRSLTRRLGFTMIAVISIAVGVGVNGVVFAVVDTFFMRDIPGVREPDRLLELSLTFASDGRSPWDFPDFQDVAARVDELEAVSMFERGTVSLSDEGAGRRLLAMYVSPAYFDAVGVTLARGRGFRPESEVGPGEHPLVVLAHETWRDHFEEDPAIVGRTIRVNRRPYQVVGVAPAEFKGHQFALQPALYVPLTQYPPAVEDPDRFFRSRGTLWGSVIARMADGVEAASAQAHLDAVMANLEKAYPTTNAGRRAIATRAALMPADGRAEARVAFAMVAGLMLIVLGASSANVGGMLLARASSRRREMAIRTALGSSRGRIVGHLVTESLLVFGAGGTLGAVLALQGMRLFQSRSTLPTLLPVRLEFALDWRMIGFALALTSVVGLLFGLAPALSAARDGVAHGLRDGGSGSGARTGRIRRAFVAGQVAVSILLLTASIVFLRSLQAGGDIDPGMDPAGVYLTPLDLALEGYSDPALGGAFVDALLERVRAMPDAEAATVAGDLPLDGSSSAGPVWPDGRQATDDRGIQSHYAQVSNGYFETLGIVVTHGRSFGPEDGRHTQRVAIVNELLAERAWPDGNAVGRTLEWGLHPASYEVVGVVKNTNTDLITDRPSPQIFTLLHQDFQRDVMLAVRQRGASDDFVARVRREMLAVDPALALGPTRALSDFTSLGMLPQRILAGVAGALGGLALFLSALGVYGVVAFMVTRRTREIGLRMALGSSRARVLNRVFADGLRLAIPGLLVGIPMAVGAAFLLRGLLVGVHPLDPITYAAVAGVFVAAVGGASLVPAHRASTVQPSEALRED